MEFKHIKVGGNITKEVVMGNDLPFTLIAGPCQLQDRDLAMKIADNLQKLTDKLGIQYIFKASFDKANRNSVNGARGIGIDEGIKIFDEIRSTFHIPVITDVHTEEQAEIIAPHVDMIQQPAFLIRQTDLSTAIAKTGKYGNLYEKYFKCPTDYKGEFEKGTTFDSVKLSYYWITNDEDRRVIGRDNPGSAIWWDIPATTAEGNHPAVTNILYLGGNVKTRELTDSSLSDLDDK